MNFKQYLNTVHQFHEFEAWSAKCIELKHKVLKTSKTKWECFEQNRTVGFFDEKLRHGEIQYK